MENDFDYRLEFDAHLFEINDDEPASPELAESVRDFAEFINDSEEADRAGLSYWEYLFTKLMEGSKEEILADLENIVKSGN